MKKFKVTLTGGGTAGHVMPHLALLPYMREQSWDIQYIGSSGIEKKLIAEAGLPFSCIRSGKLRRYFSIQNIFDVFNVLIGLVQSLVILIKRRPDVVFSKGGYVTVPVVVASWFLRIPVVAHESDYTPGLATKIAAFFAGRILYTFPETEKYLVKNRSKWVGTPIRKELGQGNEAKGLEFLGFDSDEKYPVVLVMGGSQGAQKINQLVVAALPHLTKYLRIVHLTGKGKKSELHVPGYVAFEYLGNQLADVLAATDYVVARAGANSIFEFLFLNKPMLLIPLEEGNRGDQVLNAKSFESKGWARIFRETAAKPEWLISAIDHLLKDSDAIVKSQIESRPDMNPQQIIEVLLEESKV